MRTQQLPFGALIPMAFIVVNFLPMKVVAKESKETVISSDNQYKGSLSRLLQKSLLQTKSSNSTAPIYQSSQWLAASPSVNVNYLKSQDNSNENELEVGINLAIKSSLQRKIDQQLSSLGKSISQQQVNISKLYLSGIIRESIWLYKLAQDENAYILKKISVLKKLQNNSADLVNAGESSDYGLLLIKKELVDTEIELLENKSKLNFWLNQYQSVTGESSLPEIISENTIHSNAVSWQQHPQLQLLENRWNQNKLLIQASSSDAAPWSVGLSAKNIESQGVTDTQVGLSFEMPLTMVKVNSLSIQNQSMQGKKQFDLDYQKLSLELKSQINKLFDDSRNMKSKLTLLKRSFEFSQKIMHQVDRLKLQNEMGQEIILRRVLEGLKTQYQLSKTKLMIQQNNSMVRQAAGLSL